MAHPIFGSAQQKLIRADAHLRDLVEREKAFLESKPYVQLEEADPERPGHRVRKIKLSKVLDPVFADVVADAVINYRTVLDHAAYAVAVAAGEPEPKDAYFPISRTNAAGLDNVIRGRCKDLPWQISDFFRKLKPYPGGNDALVALNNLCNTQKHALVAPVAAVASTVAASIEGNGYFSMPRPHVWDSAKNEMTLVTLGPGAEYKGNFAVVHFVAFGKVGIVDGQQVTRVLDALGGEVERILDAVEAECRRLKIIS